MGARTGVEQQYTLVRDRWTLDASCIGAAAANPTSVKTAGGIASIIRNSAGNYTLTLADKWTALLGAHFMVIDSANATHYEINVVSETVASTKTVIVQVWGAATATAPAKVDLPATATLKVSLVVTNTQQSPKPF